MEFYFNSNKREQTNKQERPNIWGVAFLLFKTRMKCSLGSFKNYTNINLTEFFLSCDFVFKLNFGGK